MRNNMKVFYVQIWGKNINNQQNIMTLNEIRYC